MRGYTQEAHNLQAPVVEDMVSLRTVTTNLLNRAVTNISKLIVKNSMLCCQEDVHNFLYISHDKETKFLKQCLCHNTVKNIMLRLIPFIEKGLWFEF